jgi:transcription initiation factor IIE alpha subunit
MKITKKVIEDVVSQVAGSDVISLVDALKDKKNISEFKLAEMIDMEVNVTRNMLYRLFNANLVTFIRKKINKKVGTYIIGPLT